MKSTAIVVMTMFLVLCPPVFADDLLLPPWQRGQAGSTYQRWEFSTSEILPAQESDFYNPNGDGPALRVKNCDNWLKVIDDRTGVWALDGELDVDIPNWEMPNPLKQIYIQLTWKPNGQDPFLPELPIIGVLSNPVGTVTMFPPTDVGLGKDWKLSQFRINISPNPYEEWFTIKGDIFVDQLVIDTICIPEPTTILLLGAGGLMALGRRRRNRRFNQMILK